MRWLFSEAPRLEKWHRWFAYFPVPLDDTSEWAWLEIVWRQSSGGIWAYRKAQPSE